jgi:hypothetical protein
MRSTETIDAARRHIDAPIARIVSVYEAWDAAEPGKGYAEQAAEWRAKLPAESEAAGDEPAHEPAAP